MSRLIAPIPILAFNALALLLAGCGGGGGSTATLSKAEFIKQADAICKKAQQAESKKLREYVREHPEILTIQPEIKKDRLVLALASPLVQREAGRLGALPAPKGEEEKVAAIVAAIEEGVKKAEEDPLSTVRGTYLQASKLSTEYGLRQCFRVL
jgi:hypothetical protein